MQRSRLSVIMNEIRRVLRNNVLRNTESIQQAPGEGKNATDEQGLLNHGERQTDARGDGRNRGRGDDDGQ